MGKCEHEELVPVAGWVVCAFCGHRPREVVFSPRVSDEGARSWQAEPLW